MLQAAKATGLYRPGVPFRVLAEEARRPGVDLPRSVFTAIGTVVNTASRAQSVAEADQILVTKAVFDRAQPDLKDSSSKAFQLKGYEVPIELYAA